MGRPVTIRTSTSAGPRHTRHASENQFARTVRKDENLSSGDPSGSVHELPHGNIETANSPEQLS